jgi:hypothetical protein
LCLRLRRGMRKKRQEGRDQQEGCASRPNSG